MRYSDKADQARQQMQIPEEQESEGSTESEPEALPESQTPLESAQQQALEKWLRQLPDDPGGLLRRKFEYQYQQKLRAYQRGEWKPSDEVRW
ncbi:hypothetical protein [Motiliproteus sp. MSK22-1]|uniref:hypothetical protein n=1 Tax=Motiliproteus sp. MSK22-1 TaxID=1897630 RepID=UPI000975E53F|nr:hypothetical protein [Motiliproteus sp. MSK22-1]OMH33678.1 hypothetical protein BGP75_11770 [Motiliproteus sp. MSK22-1]